MTNREAYLDDLDELLKEIDQLLSAVPIGKTKLEHQSREQAEDSGGRSVVCDAAPITYWSVRDGASMSEMLSLLTPNGESIYGTPAGKLENAVGVAYHPHTCGLLPIFHRGRDSWSRPVYDDGTGRLLVDVDPRAGRKPDICTKQGNAFDGEPCDPVDGDFIFIPRRDTW